VTIFQNMTVFVFRSQESAFEPIQVCQLSRSVSVTKMLHNVERSDQDIRVSCHEAFKQKTNSLSRTTNDVVNVLAVFQVTVDSHLHRCLDRENVFPHCEWRTKRSGLKSRFMLTHVEIWSCQVWINLRQTKTKMITSHSTHIV